MYIEFLETSVKRSKMCPFFILTIVIVAIVATKFGTKMVFNLSIGKHYQDKQIKPDDLKPGDHIYVPALSGKGVKSSANSTLFYHHGVYLGQGEVSDFGAVNSTHPVIRPLADFLANRTQSTLYRREYTSAVLLSPEKTVHSVRKLCRAIEETDFAFIPKYDRFKNNCEHYATKVKVDKQWSEQVERAKFWYASLGKQEIPKKFMSLQAVYPISYSVNQK